MNQVRFDEIYFIRMVLFCLTVILVLYDLFVEIVQTPCISLFFTTVTVLFEV